MIVRINSRAAVLALCLCASAGLDATAAPRSAGDPLSAIDWLEQRQPQVVAPLPAPVPDEPPVAGSITTPPVTVTPLGAPQRAAAGLLPPNVTGLPRALWSNSDAGTLSTLLTALDVEAYPALQSLLYTLLLAEADAPANAQRADFMRTRVQKLLHLGAVDPASSLLQIADPAHEDLFDLYFDTALLAGDPEPPCAALHDRPALSRDYAARIFCDARAQRWDTAALTLSTADAIGALSPLDTALLDRFFDPELFEDQTPPQAPSAPTPLQFRLFEAIGEALPTASLPRAFAATDLAGDSGWKAQAEAAERLSRVGAISENRLLGIYTSRIPSASGGIWDRIEAVQRLETALTSGDPVAILTQTARAWDHMTAAGLTVPFAALFAESLLRLPATGESADLVSRIALLSPLYEQAAARETEDATLNAAQRLAVGEPPATAAPAGSEQMRALAAAFGGADAPAALVQMSKDNRLGEAIVRALALAAAGAAGDPGALQSGIAFLRSVGLEDTSRRFALQVILSQGPPQ